MDYSALVQAIKTGDEATANQLCEEATPILRRYLMIRMGAQTQDAEDCVQYMFEYVIGKIQNDDFNNPSGLLAYMLTTCRHAYMRMVNERNMEIANEVNDPSIESDQIWSLIDEEKQQVLSYCLKKLNSNYSSMAEYLLEHPNAKTEDLADFFNISYNNAWTRKHRAINSLRNCIKKKL
ncbi:MAG: RNA polymerase sigma factor [Balneolaceae bacterium]